MGVFHIFLIVQIVPNRATHIFSIKKKHFSFYTVLHSSTPGLNLLPVLVQDLLLQSLLKVTTLLDVRCYIQSVNLY